MHYKTSEYDSVPRKRGGRVQMATATEDMMMVEDTASDNGSKDNCVVNSVCKPPLEDTLVSMFRTHELQPSSPSAAASSSNTQQSYCYRHNPRNPNSEVKFPQLQKRLEKLSSSDRQHAVQIWSLFDATPVHQQQLILEGLLMQCCLPQLSFLANSLNDIIRIDFIWALPRELAFRILMYLDAISLCHAAQVSKYWQRLADDNLLWHRMCEQHIDKKCKKCGWGLPLLESKRRSGTKQLCTMSPSSQSSSAPQSNASSATNSPRPLSEDDDVPMRETKRLKHTEEQHSTPLPTRPWKEVYAERLVVERNWRRGRYQSLVLRGHEDGVMCLQIDENSNVLITGSYDSTVRVWNLETGDIKCVLRGHTMGVRALQFEGHKLMTGSLDCTIKIWNYLTGECHRTLDGFPDGVRCLHFERHIVAGGSADGTILVWNYRPEMRIALTGHRGGVNGVVIWGGTQLFSCSDDQTIRIWDLETETCVRKLSEHAAPVQCVYPAPAALYASLCAPPRDNDSNASATVTSVPPSGHESDSEEGLILVSGSLDNTIRVWQADTGVCLRTIFGHVEGVWALALDKLRIVSGAHDKTVKVWDNGQCLHTFSGHRKPVTCIALGDTRIVTGSDDTDVRIWDFKG